MKNNVAKKVKFNCISCGLCEEICPKDCIEVKEISNIGHFPFVDEKKCIDCELCVKVCPTNLLSTKENLDVIKKIFSGKSIDKEIIKNSSSGGIVSSIIIDLFNKNKIDAVLVAFFDDELNIYGDFITSKEEVLNHSGSFYHTSKMLINIKKIKQYKSVLFVGLPCHNIAFDKFKKKFKIENVYATISLFCAIGRMKNGFYEYLKENNFEHILNTGIITYKSRYGINRPGDIIISTQVDNLKFDSNDYFHSKDYFYCPDGCLNCKKLFGVEFSDISVGDNWGIDTNEKIAVFTVNTEKGLDIITNNKLLHKKSATVEELKRSQPLGYPLKYYDRKKTNRKIKYLKLFYRILPKKGLVRKVLYYWRWKILKNISFVEKNKV